MYIQGSSYRQNSYSRINAVQYATTYALKANPYYRYFPLINDSSGDCANFVSQCLKAGGAPMTYGNNPWWYNHSSPNTTKDDTWSLSWTVAHSLYWHLKISNANNQYGAKGKETNNINELQIGDLVFFEDNKGQIFHSAIITAFNNNAPLISHHSYEALNIPIQNSWPSNKIHFLKISI